MDNLKSITERVSDLEDNKADKTEIPTKVSQLENDANYIQDDVVSDGVYAVDANGKLIDYNTADATATGVALVAGEHKFMIAKSDATDGTNTTFCWSKNLYGRDVVGIVNNSKSDGTNTNGYLPKPDGTFSNTPNLSGDFTTWTAGALAEFDGKANTAAIIAGYAEHSVSMETGDMCTVLNTFNTSDSHNDWYVPALGQLALIYLNRTEINAALTKIGGTALTYDYYWSSSECTSGVAWYVRFFNGSVDRRTKNSNGSRVRFIRDISIPKPLKERVSDLESSKQNTLISGTNIKTINGESILGSGDIVISGSNGSSSSGGSGAYAEVSHGTGDTTFTLTPNTFHVWDEVTSLDLSFADETAGVANEYVFQFTSGATPTSLTLPDTIQWVNGAPNIEANKTYQVSIVNNIGLIVSV